MSDKGTKGLKWGCWDTLVAMEQYARYISVESPGVRQPKMSGNMLLFLSLLLFILKGCTQCGVNTGLLLPTGENSIPTSLIKPK